MVINFYIACHHCQKKVWCYRGKKSKPMHSFYRKHIDCARNCHNNIEIKGDWLEEDWMNDYKTDIGIQKIAFRERKKNGN